MVPLEPIENEAGEVEIPVSNLDFTDLAITNTGHMIALKAPADLFARHEEERRVKMELQLLAMEEESFERKRPLTQKLRDAIALARSDPHAAAQKAMRDIIDKAVYWPRTISERIVEQSKISIAQAVDGISMFKDEPLHTIEALSERCLESYRSIVKKSMSSSKPRSDMIELEVVEKIIDEEALRANREKVLMEQAERAEKFKRRSLPSTLPISTVDAVQVTLTLLIDPPAMYTMRPPPSLQRDLTRFEKKVKENWRDFTAQSKGRMETIREQVLETFDGLKKIIKNKDGILEDLDPNAADLDRSSADPDEASLEIDQIPLSNSDKRNNRYPDQSSYDSNQSSHSIDDDDLHSKSPTADIDTKHTTIVIDIPSLCNPLRLNNLLLFKDETLDNQELLSSQLTLNDEEVHIVDIANKPGFNGQITGDDLIPLAFKNDFYKGPLEFDRSKRIEFEDALIADLADATNLPAKNFSIEQIRRLELNSGLLKQLKARRDFMFDQFNNEKREKEEMKRKEMLERKLLYGGVDGEKILSEFKELLLQREIEPTEEVISASAAATASVIVGSAGSGVGSDEYPSLTVDKVEDDTTDHILEDRYALVDNQDKSSSNAKSMAFSNDGGTSKDDDTRNTSNEFVNNMEVLNMHLNSSASVGDIDNMGSRVDDSVEIISTNNAVEYNVVLSDANATQTVIPLENTTFVPLVVDRVITIEPHDSMDLVVIHNDDSADVKVMDLSTTVDSAARDEMIIEIIHSLINSSFVISCSNNVDNESLNNSNIRGSSDIDGSYSNSDDDDGDDDDDDDDDDDEDISEDKNNSNNDECNGADSLNSFLKNVAENDHQLVTRNHDDDNDDKADESSNTMSNDDSLSVSEDCYIDTNENDKVHDHDSFDHDNGNNDHDNHNIEGHDSDDHEKASSEIEDDSTSHHASEKDITSKIVNIGRLQVPLIVTKSQPMKPKILSVGIINPDELRRDPKYWLAKSLDKLSERDKRKYRIARLSILRKESDLKKNIAELRMRRVELIEDSIDLIAPLVREIHPYVEKWKPIITKVN
jgi:hypothetical protein